VPLFVTVFAAKALVPLELLPSRRHSVCRFPLSRLRLTRAGTREIDLSFVGCDPEFLCAVGAIGREKVLMVRGFQ
jgi:hypothetical protein